MLAVCMGPLEKHCYKSKVILWRIRNIKNAANWRCVCHELFSSAFQMGHIIYKSLLSIRRIEHLVLLLPEWPSLSVFLPCMVKEVGVGWVGVCLGWSITFRNRGDLRIDMQLEGCLSHKKSFHNYKRVAISYISESYFTPVQVSD